jgi:hypothetical protein
MAKTAGNNLPASANNTRAVFILSLHISGYFYSSFTNRVYP